MLDAALSYASRGWYVFPCRPGEKQPLGGRGHLDASNSPDQIIQWWTTSPNANVGIAVAPSGLMVLDVDVAEGKRGRESLQEFDSQLTPTLTAITGRGGLHAVYERPADVPPRRRIGFRPGLDLIGDGYIVVAPSVLNDGTAYRWNQTLPPAPLPDVLRVEATRTAASALKTIDKAGAPIGSGGRNVALFKLGAALRDQGIGLEALAAALDAENRERCQPPVDDAELRQIVDSVWQRVTPSRDVAAGAIIEQEVHEIFQPEARAIWVKDVGAKSVPPTRFYSTGFPKLDQMLGGGFATRHQCGILGPPSSGKSAFIDCVVDSLQRQIPMLHVSTELPREELFVRYACGKLGVPWRDGMKGAVPREQMVTAVQGLRIKLIGCEDLDRNDPFGSIVQAALEMAEQMGIAPGLAIDYMQLLARGAAEQTRHKVGELSMRARMLAQTLDSPVLAVYSTNRGNYGDPKKARQLREMNDPTAYLSAAKESGDVEFDCATMLYLDVDKLSEGQPKAARIVVPRCRVGDVGFVGARAKLDVGVWWEDATALSEMGSEERNAKLEGMKMNRDVERLLDTIRKMPDRPWRDIRAGVGIGPERAAAAKARAIEDGLLKIETVEEYDKMARRVKRERLVIEAPPAPEASNQE